MFWKFSAREGLAFGSLQLERFLQKGFGHITQFLHLEMKLFGVAFRRK